ncbi:MAG: phosphatase PAP2 family protein [Actinobacteria bacterium]|nr:phosphatase PAP2 family protein [Actinomycetota bacterium]
MCENTGMSIESSWVRTLNAWGESYISLVRVTSNDLVYLVILLSAIWFFAKILKAHPIKSGWKDFLINLSVKGAVLLAIPVGVATVVSELISATYIRQRPFVAVSGVKLLVPHGADGGMPSLHMVFMTALVTTVFFYERRFAAFLAFLTLITGFARVVAGIHYPSDIVAGAVLGASIAYVYRWGMVKLFSRFGSI